MKPQYRIAMIVDVPETDKLYKTLCLCYGTDCVRFSYQPKDVFGFLSEFKPHVLIIDPLLFEECGVKVSDVAGYRNNYKYRLAFLSNRPLSEDERTRLDGLRPIRSYYGTSNYFAIASEIPKMIRKPFTARKAPLQTEAYKNLDMIFKECGFRCHMKGYPYLLDALVILYFYPELHDLFGSAKIYKKLAKKYDTSPRLVERAMIRCIESSLTYPVEQAFRKRLKIADHYQFFPVTFRNFAEIVNTYYTIEFGNPARLLRAPRR